MKSLHQFSNYKLEKQLMVISCGFVVSTAEFVQRSNRCNLVTFIKKEPDLFKR